MINFQLGKCFFLLSYSVLVVGNSALALEELTWEDCVAEARRNHPDLNAAREQLVQSGADLDLSKSPLRPKLSASFNRGLSDSSGAESSDSFGYGLSGSQLLFDGFKTAYSIKASEENLRATELNYLAVSSDIRNRLRQAFIELLRVQELIKITKEIAARRKQNLELVQLRYDAGREHRGSLLTSQADLQQAKFELQSAKRNLSLAQRRLINELGRSTFSVLSVDGRFDIDIMDRERPDFDLLAERTPFLQELIVRRKQSLYSLKVAKADFFPSLSLSAGTGGSSSQWPPSGQSWSVGASFSVPIFEGGSRFRNVEKAESSVLQAQAIQRSGRDRTLFALEQSWINWQNSLDNVEVRASFLKATVERSQISEVQYSNGLLTFDNWTIIENDLALSKKAYLDAKMAALVAKANWILAQGGGLYNEE